MDPRRASAVRSLLRDRGSAVSGLHSDEMKPLASDVPDQLVRPVPVVRIGRSRTQHLLRVLIEDRAVVVRTLCGLDLGDDRKHLDGFATCDACTTNEKETAQ